MRIMQIKKEEYYNFDKFDQISGLKIKVNKF